ncbi:MAG: DNA mismatch repair endonuclease MutL [Eubacteriales bacterium]|nr:DNA mismatch repair endonuclease MutL [Eubacteriales bacterium]
MINILSKETIDKIAAGEVAERPESVVKELLDNAIDSGADTISIEIRNGGLDLIRVTDNGCGIEKDDVRTAFLRHATSKLKTAEDIEHVITMGFRGEALASIAAVSDVELITKTENELIGTQYRISGGQEKSLKDVGVPKGSTIIVRDFLLNVPVRRQFLKSPQVENSYIVNTVEKAALAHPDLSISLSCDGRNVFVSSGSGKLKDVIYIIYGQEAAASLIPVDSEYKGVRVSGFAAKPVIARSRRDFEVFFVNGRWIRSDILKKAAEDAYAPFMMQHKYPMCVLNIDLRPEDVDVNVHPRKSEVRFASNQTVYDAVEKTISAALKESELVVNAGNAFFMKEKATKHAYGTEKTSVFEPFETKRKFDYVSSITEEIAKNEAAARSEAAPNESRNGNTAAAAMQTAQTAPAQVPAPTPPAPAGRSFMNKASAPYFKLIGQVFETYWIIEFNDEMYIIDQHAAHEKVNFEHFMSLIKNHAVESQMLFPPLVLTLDAKTAVLFDKFIDSFQELGYDIEYAGDRDYIVRAVPSNLPELGDEAVLKSLIDSLFEDGRGINSELIHDKIASMSCKAAVKGNMVVTETEMRALIGELLTLENPYACPHGRPTIVKWSHTDLDRLFKRIVN